ncbi:MAG: hypothetical protein LZF62_130041 [Nitrospira sp.]|nr:MAG: hypothetical protein LZF62_130041 [Nitrospira sp.]
MNADLPKYWSRVWKSPKGWVHPDDEEILNNEPHSFNLDFPPPAFVGDVTTARIIILLANSGYDPTLTPQEFAAPGSEARYLRRFSAPQAATWTEVSPYYRDVNYAELVFSGKAALVNACAYRSFRISIERDNQRLLNRLPSVHFTRGWLLQEILPQVEAGARFVVVKRRRLWALPETVWTIKGVYLDPAPRCRHMSKDVLERLQEMLA